MQDLHNILQCHVKVGVSREMEQLTRPTYEAFKKTWKETTQEMLYWTINNMNDNDQQSVIKDICSY